MISTEPLNVQLERTLKSHNNLMPSVPKHKFLFLTISLFISHIELTEGLSLHHVSKKTFACLPPSQGNDSISRRQFTTSTATLTTLSSLLLNQPKPCEAEEPNTETKTEELKRIYDAQASTYETLYSESFVSRKLDFDSLRKNLLSKARGNVLELGVGTGLNLPHYPDNDGITSYTAVDLSPNMLEQAKLRFEQSSLMGKEEGNALVSPSLQSLYEQKKVSFQIADVGKLTSLFQTPSDGKDIEGGGVRVVEKFDTIIDTFGLCVFPNPQAVLTQTREILSPNNGQLLLLEHQDSVIAKILSPTRKLSDVSNTCRYDDDVRNLVRSAGYNNVAFEDLAGGFLISVTAINNEIK